jgi:hypothetical protein
LKVGRSYYKKLLAWLSRNETVAADETEEFSPPPLRVVRGLGRSSGSFDSPHSPMIR